MQIHINGEIKKVQAQTVQQLAEELELSGKRIAIEHNLQIIPRSRWGQTFITDNDRVEIVHAIGGG